MLFLRTVTEKRFIRKLRKKLRSLSKEIVIYDNWSSSNILTFPVQPESSYVIRVTAESVDLGESLQIRVDFCSIRLIRGSNRFDLAYQSQWSKESRIYSVRQRRQLSRYCKHLATVLYQHYDEVNNMMPVEFFQNIETGVDENNV